MDALATFARWRSTARIRELATVGVLTRSEGEELEESGLIQAAGAIRIGTRRVDVSSSEIRHRVAEGKSIRGFVAESVEAYISTANLYRSAPQPARTPGR
jgi:nicotinate-nucleotide adenylyltransferase